MINAKMIARIMGALFFIEAGFLILCSFLAVYYNESDIVQNTCSGGGES